MSAPRGYLDYLDDIATALDAVASFLQGLDLDGFRSDIKTVYAVTRALEIAGESVKRLPEDVRARHPGIPWRLMAGMRDRLIHGYDTVDVAILWQTATQDVAALRDPLAEVIRQERIAAGESA
ncbi:MAG: DUF86 domain-containing protein [Chloroflexi bacterium]|nr:DUF86 domain-containing protein [Chloroflexota bacterium]